MNQKRPRIRRVLHLGNMDYGTKANLNAKKLSAKTQRYADRFKRVHFVGIDLEHPGFARKNWTQLKGDFLEKMSKFRDNSTDIISSEYSLGYHGPKGAESWRTATKHTTATINCAYKKLRPGGKLMIVAGESALQTILESVAATPFSMKKMTVKKVSPKEETELFG